MLRIKNMKLLNGKAVDFELNAGDTFIIKGKNGSGKSLLLKSIAKLLPAPAESFTYQDKPVSSYQTEIFRSEVLYISATPTSLGQTTVEEFFESVFRLKIYHSHSVSFPWRDYLQKWHITEKEFQNLSSGQKQMLSILRALSLKAKVLLLDEATANLDHEKTLEIEELIKDWQKNTGGTLVMISHSEEQSKRLGFQVVPFESLVK